MRALVVAALVAVVPLHAHAQCRVAGDVDVTEVTFGPVTLTSIHLDAVEVGWPEAATGPSRARLRTPFDAEVRIPPVRFHVVPSALPRAFFRVAEEATGLEVEIIDGRAAVRIGRVRAEGVDIPCDGLRFGAGFDRAGFAEGHIGTRRVTDALRVHAEPNELAPSLRLTPLRGSPVLLDVLERRSGWTRVASASGEGVTVIGWAPTDPAAEADGSYGAGSGGFTGRAAHVPGWPTRRDGCHEGPALLRARVPIYADEATTEPWGHVIDARTLLFRDCGGARIEVVAAMGRTEPFGWIEASDVSRMGLRVCGPELTVLQSPTTMRIHVADTTDSAFRVGDEIVRLRSTAIVGPPFDTVTPTWPELVCQAWREGDRLVVVRDRARFEVTRD